ncbi:MAG: sulfate adenylyltransferase subunit CysD [Candidatus Omnitrophota bacterium]
MLIIKKQESEYLKTLESKSIYIIREAYCKYRNQLALLWSIGKDSTTLLHLIRKAFFGTIPFYIIHLDTTYKFKAIYDFRDRYAKKYGLKLIVAKNDAALREDISPEKGRYECCNALKTEALKQVAKKHHLKALLVGIRRDEHVIRAKERFYSTRNEDFKWDYQNQPFEMWAEYTDAQIADSAHLRVHPLLHWREIDIWRYIKQERLPIVDLYFAKDGKRFRSIGCECCCQPIVSSASSIDRIISELTRTKIAERSGRAQDKEKAYMMQKLRSLGYM